MATDNPAVVCEPCRDCKYTDCVAVCPAECFYQDDLMLYVDPEDCISCELCLPECPVEAIYMKLRTDKSPEVPAPWASYVELNETRSAELKAAGENITAKQEPKRGPGCADPSH